MFYLKATLIAATIFIFSAMSTMSVHAETKNGIYEVEKEEVYEIKNKEVRKKEKTIEYYINDKPYTGYVEFGDGIHYFDNGKPIQYQIIDNEYEIYDRKGKRLDDTNENYQSIKNMITGKIEINLFKDIRYAAIGKNLLKHYNIETNLLKCKEGYLLKTVNQKENIKLKRFKLIKEKEHKVLII